MKVCGNGRTTHMINSVIFTDSHDIYYTWNRSRDMSCEMQLNEWEILLKNNPDSDVLFFCHPKEEADRNGWEEPWKTKRIRELNLKYKNNRHIIFHAFLWTYSSIRELSPFIKYQGFDYIQVTPCQGVKGDGKEFWEYYQPLKMSFCDNPLGTREEFINMCKETNIIMDVIFRHVAGDNYGNLIPHHKVDNNLLKYVLTDKVNCDDYSNRWEYTNLATGMPMMNIWDEEYQKVCIEFIEELISYGIKGLRLDQMKHYPIHSEGCNFLRNVFKPYEDKLILYGEIIDCPKHINDLYVNNY